jgi:hypothetical protein
MMNLKLWKFIEKINKINMWNNLLFYYFILYKIILLYFNIFIINNLIKDILLSKILIKIIY